MSNKGFTIVEILVVFIIVGILLVVGVGSYFIGLEKAREISAEAGLRLLHVTLEFYATDHEGRYPQAKNLSELLAELKDYLVDRELPENPYNNKPYRDDNNDHYKITYTYDPIENVYTLTVMNRYNTKILLLLSNKIVVKH
ncbi:MAG: type II secretion system protein [Dictyoglomaceae bacterium]